MPTTSMIRSPVLTQLKTVRDRQTDTHTHTHTLTVTAAYAVSAMQHAIKRSLVVFMSVCFLRTVTLSCDGELLRHGYYIISILTALPIFNILMNCGSIFSVQNRPNNLLLNSLRLQSIYELSPFSIVNTILQQLTYWTSVNSVLGGP